MARSDDMAGLTDEDLFDRLKGDKKAEEEFYRRYKNKVRWLIKNYRLNPSEREDLIQEGMIGLFSAINTYDRQRGIKISTYATVCIKNRINNAVSALWKRSRKENVGRDVEDITTDDTPENDMILREVTDKIESAIVKLAPLEKQVLELYLNKKTYRQIAKELDISTKKVDNIMMKIKARLAMKLDSSAIELDEEIWSDKLKNSIQRGLKDDEAES